MGPKVHIPGDCDWYCADGTGDYAYYLGEMGGVAGVTVGAG